MTISESLQPIFPNSVESEIVVLGTVILNNKKLWEVVDRLSPDDFYLKAHSLVYRAILKLSDDRKDITPQLIIDVLKKEGQHETVGGLTFVVGLTRGVSPKTSLKHYLDLIKEKSVERQKIKLSEKYKASLLSGDVEEAAKTEQELYNLSNAATPEEFITPSELSISSLRQIHKVSKNPSRITGLETGIERFDMMTSGLQPEDLIIIAARPSMGKSALCMTIAQNAAVHNDASVAVFSLEMSAKSLYNRMLAAEARVDSNKIRSGYLSMEEWARVIAATDILKSAKIHMDSQGGISPMQMRAKLNKLMMKGVNLDLIIVDYIQLMSGSGSRFESRQQEVSQISRELKAIAKEMKLPLVALSQLSRAPETRKNDHRPQLSDLRDSGAIEQDADIVGFIFREEQYTKTPENEGMAELIIAKQRNGPTGTVNLAFIKELTRFENLWEVST